MFKRYQDSKDGADSFGAVQCNTATHGSRELRADAKSKASSSILLA